MARQYLIPGQCYLNESYIHQYLIPGSGYINDDTLVFTIKSFLVPNWGQINIPSTAQRDYLIAGSGYLNEDGAFVSGVVGASSVQIKAQTTGTALSFLAAKATAQTTSNILELLKSFVAVLVSAAVTLKGAFALTSSSSGLSKTMVTQSVAVKVSASLKTNVLTLTEARAGATGKTALAGKASSSVKAKEILSGAILLTGKALSALRAKPALTFTAVLLSKAATMVRAKAALGAKGVLLTKALIAIHLRGLQGDKASLMARASVEVKSKLGPVVGSLSIFGRAIAQVKALLSPAGSPPSNPYIQVIYQGSSFTNIVVPSFSDGTINLTGFTLNSKFPVHDACVRILKQCGIAARTYKLQVMRSNRSQVKFEFFIRSILWGTRITIIEEAPDWVTFDHPEFINVTG